MIYYIKSILAVIYYKKYVKLNMIPYVAVLLYVKLQNGDEGKCKHCRKSRRE